MSGGGTPGQRSVYRRWSLLVAAACVVAVASGADSGFADPASPITVTKTASASPVASGAQLTYTIVVKNTGGAKVDNVVLTDQVNGVGVIQNPPALPQLTITSTQGQLHAGRPERQPRHL